MRSQTLDEIGKILAVVTGADELRYLSTDVYKQGAQPLAAARPASTDDVSRLLRYCHDNAIPVIARGGGASYTDGYLHEKPGGITIDTAGLDGIVVDENNALVVVGAGVSWASLHKALAQRGWRTPFWGPFSGLVASVGGSVSQHSVSHGTGAFGISAESVLGLEVVTGTGEILRTGSWGVDDTPFHRFCGPDIAGLFTGDCGALGVKTRIALKMIRRKPACETISFNFTSFDAMHQAARAIAVEGLDDEGFGLDRALQQGQIGRQEDFGSRARVAAAIMRSSPSWISGIGALARMARAGTRALCEPAYAMHYLVDGVNAAEARAKLDALRKIGSAHGIEIPDTVPQVVRAMPFAPLFNMLGPKGERWVPIHGIFAHDRVSAFHHDLAAFRADHAEEMQRLGVWHGNMFMAIGSSGFLYEPATYWPGQPNAYHHRQIPGEHLESLPQYDHCDEATALVERMKGQMITLMQQHGAAHFQLGKIYPYTQNRNPASLALLRAVKRELDPRGILNPGVLGL